MTIAGVSTVESVRADAAAARVRARIDSVDLLRGAVMVIMALDHVRDFFHNESQLFAPEDLANTYGVLFFTRWITHFCAPAFFFLAGAATYLYSRRGRTTAEVSRFLWTRGLFLVVLELTVVSKFGWTFNLDFQLVPLLVIWALGWSMIALAVLIHLPWRALLAVSLGTIALHNAFDGVGPEAFGPLAWLWQVLHVFSQISAGPVTIQVGYPLIPWVAVMAAGFCFGRVFDLDPDRRRRLLLRLGLGLTAAFIVLRGSNLYGDPFPWSAQPTIVLTIVSFLNCAKYPPSLCYLLMTLGPSLIALAWLEKVRVFATNPFLVFGRVPMFYYLLHLPLIHATALVFAWFAYGRIGFIVGLPAAILGPKPGFPSDYGYDLWLVYAVWIAIVAALYPACRWYAGVKQRSRSPLLSYL